MFNFGLPVMVLKSKINRILSRVLAVIRLGMDLILKTSLEKKLLNLLNYVTGIQKHNQDFCHQMYV